MQLRQIRHAIDQKFNHTQVQVTRVEYQYFQLSKLILVQTPLWLKVAHGRCEALLIGFFVVVLTIFGIMTVVAMLLAEVGWMHEWIVAEIQ